MSDDGEAVELGGEAMGIGRWTLVLAVAATGVAQAGSRAPLADAVEKRNGVEVGTLLKSGSDVNAAQADGMTALHWAAQNDDAQAAKQLLAAGANANAQNRYGVRPLTLACVNGNAEIVEALLEAGADPNATIAGGETPLMTAARTGRSGPVKLLLARGAKVDAKEKKGQTALMWAAADGNAEVVDLLLAAKSDVNASLSSGFTPLFFAVRQGHIPVVKRLLEAGAPVNATLSGKGTKKPLSALLLAIENGHFALAAMLLDSGADANGRPSGFTALHAITWVRKPIRGDGDPPPDGSGKLTSLDMVRKLVAAGADVNARLEKGEAGRGRFNTNGSTPFLLAARGSDLELMKLLLELGANPTIPNVDDSTPLLAAAGVGALGDGDEAAATEPETLEAVKFLLDLGADVNAVDKNGETAMHGAAYQDRPQVARLLVERGSNVAIWNRENKWGWTPWLIAEGHRPGNFRPAPETIAALDELMRSKGVIPPPPRARSGPVKYD